MKLITKIKNNLLLYGGVLLLVFLLVFSFINMFHEFNLISSKVSLYVLCIATVVLTVLLIIVVKTINKSDKKTKFKLWVDVNEAKLTLAYILLFLLFR